MSNQTIDGVPRELLERIARAGIWQNEVKELRALLDAEQPPPSVIDDNVEFEKWWMGTPILRKQKIQIAQEAWFARAKLDEQAP